MYIEYMIFAFCMVGAGISCFNAGVRTGAEKMFDALESMGDKESDGTIRITLKKG